MKCCSPSDGPVRLRILESYCGRPKQTSRVREPRPAYDSGARGQQLLVTTLCPRKSHPGSVRGATSACRPTATPIDQGATWEPRDRPAATA